MSDLRERVPAQALMERVISLRGTPDLVDLPLGIVKLSKDAVCWLRGVRGELEMARELRSLGEGWVVLHSVPVGTRGSDIDHIVIGPTGIFPINSKRLIDRNVWVAGGRFLVDGLKREYLRNSDYEATRVENVLRARGIPVRATPVIAVSGAKRITIRSTPRWNSRNIGVVRAEQVARRMKRRSTILSPAQVAAVVALFSDPAVWSRKPVSSSSAVLMQAEFARIDRGVTRWNIMIAAIGIALAVGLAVAVWGSASLFVR